MAVSERPLLKLLYYGPSLTSIAQHHYRSLTNDAADLPRIIGLRVSEVSGLEGQKRA
jgi:hypothetical protein